MVPRAIWPATGPPGPARILPRPTTSAWLAAPTTRRTRRTRWSSKKTRGTARPGCITSTTWRSCKGKEWQLWELQLLQFLQLQRVTLQECEPCGKVRRPCQMRGSGRHCPLAAACCSCYCCCCCCPLSQLQQPRLLELGAESFVVIAVALQPPCSQ